jgi:hypothetical protein
MMNLIILTKSDLYSPNVKKARVDLMDIKQSVINDVEKADLVLYIDDKHVEVLKSRF